MSIVIKENVSLAPLTTFNIGGPARYFADVATDGEMREALHSAHDFGVRPIILAGGSNVLVLDEGVEGLVVHIVSKCFLFSGDELEADAGCDLLGLIREAGKRGMGGWEKLAGIPGTVGGAVRGNAGAFGTEIKDCVTKVRALNSGTGNIHEFSNSQCKFAYRSSYFKDRSEWIIVNVQIHLSSIPSDISLYSIEETIKEREKRHLQNVKAAGSFFMNPVAPAEVVAMFEKEKGAKAREGRVPAGWLIEKAGLKGAVIGGAIASLQHPNYIVNMGDATSHDVQELARRIKDAVKKEFGILLEEEAEVLTV